MSKKRVAGAIILGAIMIYIFGISLVSAGFWSKITGKEIEVGLTITSVPEIVYISEIGGATTEGAVPASDRDLVAGDTGPKMFEFYVIHSNLDALPGGSSGVPVTDANALITLRDINSPNSVRKSSDGGDAISCSFSRDISHNTDADDLPAIDIGTVNVRVYTCTVAMQYYDDFGSTTNKNWEVRAYIKDIYNQEDGYDTAGAFTQNTYPSPGRYTYFSKLKMFRRVGGPLLYGILDYSDTNKQPADASGVYPLEVQNTGNADIVGYVSGVTAGTELTSYDIPGKNIKTDVVDASWFRVDEQSADVCNTGQTLIDSTAVTTKLPQINHGSDAIPLPSSSFRVCLTQVLTSASPQEYSTTVIPEGTNWNVNTVYVGG